MRNEITIADRKARNTTSKMLNLCSGQSKVKFEMRIPIDPGLAKLQRAYVAIASALGWKRTQTQKH